MAAMPPAMPSLPSMKLKRLVIHTTASWALLAPTRPLHPADADDPAYRLGDLDELVREAPRYGLRTNIRTRRLLQAVDAERERSGLSKADLARRLDLNPAAVRRLLGGGGANPVSLDPVWDPPRRYSS